ncbi:unnamed protein product [Thelazia callipaeda]|uniref:F-box domain-containing protein n=1 Tax=Thelazia callipaeda TaxID=103827 RepID=A0A0N5CN27_THECL|nr:unnamed protein product [Thelazia callipaeda]
MEKKENLNSKDENQKSPKENVQQMQSNARKRKQFNNSYSGFTPRRKVRVFSNETEVDAPKCRELSPFETLPTALLIQIVHHLNINDQRCFRSTCTRAHLATALYWQSRYDLNIQLLMQKTFPYINSQKLGSLYAMRKEVGRALQLIPAYTLRSVTFNPICSLHVQNFYDIEIITKKSAEQLFGALKHLDLRGCTLEVKELKYFSRACQKLSSIALTYSYVYLPDEVSKVDGFETSDQSESCPKLDILEFLSVSLPGFRKRRKNGEIPEKHISFIAKLLTLFPFLETFIIN